MHTKKCIRNLRYLHDGSHLLTRTLASHHQVGQKPINSHDDIGTGRNYAFFKTGKHKYDAKSLHVSKINFKYSKLIIYRNLIYGTTQYLTLIIPPLAGRWNNRSLQTQHLLQQDPYFTVSAGSYETLQVPKINSLYPYATHVPKQRRTAPHRRAQREQVPETFATMLSYSTRCTQSPNHSAMGRETSKYDQSTPRRRPNTWVTQKCLERRRTTKLTSLRSFNYCISLPQ